MRIPRSTLSKQAAAVSKFKVNEIVQALWKINGVPTWLSARISKVYHVLDEDGQPYVDVMNEKQWILVKCPTKMVRRATVQQQKDYQALELTTLKTLDKKKRK